MNFLHVISLFALVAAASGAVWNPEEYKPEKSYCPAIIPDPNLDEGWLKTIPKWYIPQGNKRDIYLAVKEGTGADFAKITDEAIKDSCFMITGLKGELSTVHLHGLNRKLLNLQMSYRPLRKGIVDYFIDGHLAWTTYIILTDNKTYRLQIDENADGTRDFRVATVVDNVPAEEYEKMYKAIEFYGFSKSDVYTVKSTCENDAYLLSVPLP